MVKKYNINFNVKMSSTETLSLLKHMKGALQNKKDMPNPKRMLKPMKNRKY